MREIGLNHHTQDTKDTIPGRFFRPALLELATGERSTGLSALGHRPSVIGSSVIGSSVIGHRLIGHRLNYNVPVPGRSRILYFHGFASSPASAKAVALRGLLAPDGIDLHVPDLNIPSFARLDFEAIVAFASREASEGSFAALAGSSMGTLVALEVARRGFDLPLVLIAPAFALAERWRDLLPDGDPVMVFNHALGHDAPIHRQFFERMEAFRPEDEPPRMPVTALMGRLDESVPFDGVQRTWERWSASGNLATGSRFIEVPDGDHSLLAHVELIARELRRAVGVNESAVTVIQET